MRVSRMFLVDFSHRDEFVKIHLPIEVGSAHDKLARLKQKAKEASLIFTVFDAVLTI